MMPAWLKGLIASLLLILIGVVAYSIDVTAGFTSASAALICTAIAAFFIFALLYAMEENSFQVGLALPFIIVVGVLTGYFGQPPLSETLFSSFLGAVLAFVLTQEEDH